MLSKFPVSIFIAEYVYHTSQGECSFRIYIHTQIDGQTGRVPRCIHYTSRQMYTDTHWKVHLDTRTRCDLQRGVGAKWNTSRGRQPTIFHCQQQLIVKSVQCSCAQWLTHAKLLSLLRHFLKLQIRSSSIAPREPVTSATEQICCSPSATNYMSRTLWGVLTDLSLDNTDGLQMQLQKRCARARCRRGNAAQSSPTLLSARLFARQEFD